MMATALHAKNPARANAHGFTGTRHLVRLALRRDRVILPIWVVLLSFTVGSSVAGYEQLYPSAADRAALTASMSANPSVAVVYGPAFDLATAGGFTAWRLGSFLALFAALMAIFTVTRHTRAEEDTGRLELLSAGVLGRHAAPAAAVLVSGGASLLVGVLEAVTLTATGVPATGSWVLGLSTAGAGLVFTGVSAVAAQLAEYSRTANGIGSAVLGVAFLLRAVGDSTSDLRWLSWLSPLGWAQQARPFAGDRWWVLLLPLAVAVVLLAAAAALLPKRDLGSGLLPPRPGPARGATSLRSPLALAWRLHRASLIGWAVGLVLIGAVFGSIANGIGDIVGSSEQTKELFQRMGGSSAIIDAYLATMTSMYGMIAGIYGVQAVLRMRSEEVGVRAEPLLATKVSRLSWTASHLVFAFLGTALLTGLAGLATGLAHGLRSGAVGDQIGNVLGGTVAQLPAVWVVVAVGALLFGALPKYAVAAWGVATGCLLLTLLGPMLRVPQVVLDVSPFSHIPKIPGSQLTMTPLLWLSAIAVVALAAGLVTFRRRDIG